VAAASLFLYKHLPLFSQLLTVLEKYGLHLELLPPPRTKEVMFSSAFVCLFVSRLSQILLNRSIHKI